VSEDITWAALVEMAIGGQNFIIIDKKSIFFGERNFQVEPSFLYLL